MTQWTQFQKFTIEERVRWGDVDAAGIIFYGSYIRFLRLPKQNWFRAAGLPTARCSTKLNIWLPRVHLECDFHRATRLDDLLEVSVYVGKDWPDLSTFEFRGTPQGSARKASRKLDCTAPSRDASRR